MYGCKFKYDIFKYISMFPICIRSSSSVDNLQQVKADAGTEHSALRSSCPHADLRAVGRQRLHGCISSREIPITF